jgi:hypothetical protein
MTSRPGVPLGTAFFYIEAGTNQGQAIVAITVRPMLREGTGVSATRTQLSFAEIKTFYFRVIVNELGGEFALVPNFDTETLEIRMYENRDQPWTTGAGTGPVPYDHNGVHGVEFLYTLRAAADGAGQAGERWLPVLGNTIDISRLVPRSGNTVFRFAVRRADAEPEGGSFGEDDRNMIEIRARRTVATPDRRSIIVRDGLLTRGTVPNMAIPGNVEVLYRIGIGQWSTSAVTLGQINDADVGISLLAQHNPMGGTAEVRFAAITDAADPNDNRFASVPFRVRIPRPMRAPRLRVNANRGTVTGINQRMEWSIDGNEWHAVPVGVRAVPIADLRTTFTTSGGATLTTELRGDTNYVVLFIRTAERRDRHGAVRSPASPPMRFLVAAP